MSSENVITSMLVELGFKVDTVEVKKFVTTIESIKKEVLKVGLAVSGMATGIVAGVAVISNQMEKLYYASQRTGETVGRLMALRYAAAQIGLTAEQAQGALEGFARELRLNPGKSGLLDSLGVASGNPAERFEGFIQQMKAMQPQIAAAYAALFGIDPDTLLMLENGLDTLRSEQDKYALRLAAFGINSEDAAKAGKDFNNIIRRGASDMTLLWTVIESKLVPVLTPLIEKFEKWAESHAPDMAQRIADAVEKMAKWIDNIDWNKWLDNVDEFMKKADKAAEAVGGWTNVLIGLAALKFAGLIAGLGGITGAVLGLASALGVLGTAGLAGGAAWLGLQIAKLLGLPEVSQAQGEKELASGEYLKASSHMSAGSFIEGAARKLMTGSKNLPRGIRNNNPGNIKAGKFADSQGAIGSDGTFAIFPDMETGRKASQTLLQGYLGRGADTIRKVISRWAPSSENNTDAYVNRVAEQLGISPDAKLGNGNIGALSQAIFGHENGAAYANAFGSTKIGSSNATGGVTLHQSTEINVNGTRDSEGTGRAVAREQTRVNGDIARAFEVAYQ